MKANDAKRLKEHENENAMLKHAVVELALDKQIPKEGINEVVIVFRTVIRNFRITATNDNTI